MCCSKAKLKSRCLLFWKLLRRKPPVDEETANKTWKTFNDVILKRAYYIHIVGYLLRLEAWRSEEEIMQAMT